MLNGLYPTAARVTGFGPGSRGMAGWLLAAVLLAAAGQAQPAVERDAGPGEEGGVIRSMGDFWRVEEAARREAHPVAMEVTVHYFDAGWNLLWGADGEGDFFMPTVAGEPLAVRAGQRVRLEGRVVPARGFSGREVRATVLATEAWPAPRPLPVDPMDATGLDAAWVVAEGSVVRQLESDATHVQYDLLSGGRRLRVRLLVDPAEPIPNLLEKRVRVRAVHVPQRNPAGRVVRTDLWVPRRQDIAVLGAVGEDERFKLPRTMLDQLREAVGRDWVRVAGTVKAWQEGEAVTLRDETGELTVVTAQPGPLAPGTAVELVGRPQEVEGGVVLKAPFLRPVATWPARTLMAPRQAGGVVAPLKLRVAAQVLELEPAEAARGYPVALRGVVTWSHAAADFYFVQDSTGGVRVRVAEGITPPPPGTPVSVEGVTVLGAFAPELRGTGIAGANPINALAPREVSLEHALTGSEEARLVTLRGYVRAVVPERAWRRLELATAAGEFEAWAPAGDDDRALIGALVRVTGVCEAEADGRRQLTGIRLWVPDAEAVRPRLRVLLMDDEEFIRDLGVRALAHGGHEVTTVADGKAAVAAYAVAGEAGRPFDVVVLDLTVPGGMGGEETVRELLRMDPGARVIVSSGYSSNPVMARYREHGFCAVVPKPYEIGVLLRTVESVARG
jgi:CheY-like chemotaxis protein/uncharacterized protein YdeI (BOF family)